MADVVRSHGGDCEGGPPGGGPPEDNWLPVYGCQASGVPKRGRTRNVALKEIIRKSENLLPIEFEKDDKTYVAVGDNGDSFNTLIGTIVSRIPSYYDSWSKVPAQYRTTIIPEIETYYDLRPHLEGPLRTEIKSGIFTYCQRRYRGQKNKFKKDWFENRGGLPFVDLLRSMPPPNVEDDDWNKFLNRMASPAFQARSAKAKESRAKQKITVHQGRRSMVQNRYANRDPVTQELPSPIDEYRRLRSRGGKFTSVFAAENHAKMIAMKEEQANQPTPMSDQDIMETVLHPRRGWKCGIGQQLSKSAASSSNASETSQRLYTQDEVSQMMSEMQNNMRKEMQMHTAPLFKAMASRGLIQVDEDNDEDEDEDYQEDQDDDDDDVTDTE